MPSNHRKIWTWQLFNSNIILFYFFLYAIKEKGEGLQAEIKYFHKRRITRNKTNFPMWSSPFGFNVSFVSFFWHFGNRPVIHPIEKKINVPDRRSNSPFSDITIIVNSLNHNRRGTGILSILVEIERSLLGKTQW